MDRQVNLKMAAAGSLLQYIRVFSYIAYHACKFAGTQCSTTCSGLERFQPTKILGVDLYGV